MEIKFIALPHTHQLRKGNRNHEMNPMEAERKLKAYDNALFRLHLAQRTAAVFATEFLRPEEYRHLKSEYQIKVQQAREEFHQKALDVFSEVCTKGL